jgi:hypothetical protein
MSLYEWKELKKTIPLFEDRGPELRTMDNKEAELELKVNLRRPRLPLSLVFCPFYFHNYI